LIEFIHVGGHAEGWHCVEYTEWMAAFQKFVRVTFVKRPGDE